MKDQENSVAKIMFIALNSVLFSTSILSFHTMKDLHPPSTKATAGVDNKGFDSGLMFIDQNVLFNLLLLLLLVTLIETIEQHEDLNK